MATVRLRPEGREKVRNLKRKIKPRRVLIATANEQVLAAASGTLQAAGYDVHAVRDGAEVLVQASGDGADLYMVDRDLPQLDGVRLARYLRQSYHVSRSSILILHPHSEPISYAAEVQVTDVLPWPFTGVELLLCVTRHLDPEKSSKKLPGATEL